MTIEKISDDQQTTNEQCAQALLWIRTNVRPDSTFTRRLREALPKTYVNNEADDAKLVHYELLLPLSGSNVAHQSRALDLFKTIRERDDVSRAELRGIAERCEALIVDFPVTSAREALARLDPDWCARVVRQRHESAEAFDLWREYAKRIVSVLEA